MGRLLPHLPLPLLGWLAAALLAAPAAAAPPDPERPGPFCTRASCAGTTSSSKATAAAFAATAFGSGVLARRQRACSDQPGAGGVENAAWRAAYSPVALRAPFERVRS